MTARRDLTVDFDEESFNKNVEYEFISSIVSVNIINLNRENNIYLKSNIVNNRNNDYKLNNKSFKKIKNGYKKN